MSDDKYGLHNFSQLIAQHEDGSLNGELTELLRDVIAELNQQYIDHGGKPTASITLKLSFKLDSQCIEITADKSHKLPKDIRGKSIYWATEGNMLTRMNPRQQELPFRDVATPRRETADVG